MIARTNFQLLLSAFRTQSRGGGRKKKKKRGRVLAGSVPRCHGECGEWNNAHVTAAIRSFFSFRSKGLIGAVRSAVGTNNGGRAERAARGQRERRLKNGDVEPPALPARSPPPACWINFGTDAWLRRSPNLLRVIKAFFGIMGKYSLATIALRNVCF